MKTFKEFINEARPATYKPGSGSLRPVDIAHAATKVDKHLDKTYGYGTVKGGVSPIAGHNRAKGFGAVANYNSAEAGMRAIKSGETKRGVGQAIHKGWGKTVSQMPAAEPKQSQRQALKDKSYSELDKGEQSKDDVIGNRLRKFLKR